MTLQFRILTYNVMSRGPEKAKRLKHIATNILKNEDVDFVLLQDIVPEDIEFWKGELYQQGYLFCMGGDVIKTKKYGDMIFSRLEMTDVKYLQFNRSSKGISSCKVYIDRLGTVLISTMHLESSTGAGKALVDRQISNVFKNLQGESIAIVAGDFGNDQFQLPVSETEGQWLDAWKLKGRGEFGTHATYYNNRFDGDNTIGKRQDYIIFKGDIKPISFYKIGSKPNRMGLYPSSHDGIVCIFEFEERDPEPEPILESLINEPLSLPTPAINLGQIDLDQIDLGKLDLNQIDLSKMDLGKIDLDDGEIEDDYLGV